MLSEVKIGGISVHTRAIIELLNRGDIKGANALLGREYNVLGYIVKGQGLGAKELVPTLNLTCSQSLPMAGVYAMRAFVDGAWQGAVGFVGHRLSTDNKLAFEVHILDKDIAKPLDSLEVAFVQKIRQNLKFASLKALKKQILSDIQMARNVL